uniref:Uncharacterized protein LOC114327754 n=1 Tax=Diabrotica virgifera virgifera TaxID=50390 RepID=A0A6P7FBR8_DIAVI
MSSNIYNVRKCIETNRAFRNFDVYDTAGRQTLYLLIFVPHFKFYTFNSFLCYVFSTLLYGVEGWTLTDTLLKKLEAFEIWVYRRILRIGWVDRVRKGVVMHRMGKVTEVVRTVKNLKLEYFGHVMRHPYYTPFNNTRQGRRKKWARSKKNVMA